MIKGVALTETWTEAGQLVFICLSSWWKHFSCNSKSDRHISVWWTVGFSWNTWLLTARLCSSLKGGSMIPSRTGKVSRSSSSSARKYNFLYKKKCLHLFLAITEYLCLIFDQTRFFFSNFGTQFQVPFELWSLHDYFLHFIKKAKTNLLKIRQLQQLQLSSAICLENLPLKSIKILKELTLYLWYRRL